MSNRLALLGQSLRFGAVGALNTAVGLGIIWTCMALGAHPGLANVVGYSAGLICSFTFNRTWVFSSRGGVRGQLPRFVLVVAIAYLLNLAVVLRLAEGGGLQAYLAQLAGNLVYTPVMFIGLRWFVFLPSPETGLHS